jgi:TolA-binding protein
MKRKEIKQDALVTFYVKAQKFLRKYGNRAGFAVLAIAAVILFTVWMSAEKRKAGRDALGRLGLAEYYLFQKSDINQAQAELAAILNTYPGTEAAGTAAYLLGNIFFQAGEYSQAEDQYRLYLDKYKNHKLFTGSSFAGIAACLENRGSFQEAGDYYSQAASNDPDSFSAPFYLKDAARCYKHAGDKEKAHSIYRRIEEKYPRFSASNDIHYLIKTL